jgi:3-oxoacid CoA-transferase B subunit
MSAIGWDLPQWAERVAESLGDARYVNLGVGLPAKLPHYLASRSIMFHCENGIVGTGPAPDAGDEIPELIDASSNSVSLQPGGVIVPFEVSFSIIRGGHLDATVLGAYQVSAGGDLANWSIPGARIAGVGGAMDLAVGARRVIVMMHHTNRDGSPKIVDEITYPMTARGCVDVIVTNCAVIDVTPAGLIVRDVPEGVTIEELQGMTGAPLRLSVAATRPGR